MLLVIQSLEQCQIGVHWKPEDEDRFFWFQLYQLLSLQCCYLPVSYTHLDVYKRQTRYFAEQGILFNGKELIRPTLAQMLRNPVYVQADLDAVSYTHLKPPFLVPRRTSGQNVPNLWTHSQKANRFFSQNWNGRGSHFRALLSPQQVIVCCFSNYLNGLA